MGGRTKVFLSHSFLDRAWAEQFSSRLRAEGFDVFPDTNRLAAGTPWHERIIAELRESDAVVMLFDAMTLHEPNALFELGAAMAGKKTVVPVVPADLDLSALPLPLEHVLFVEKDGPDATAARVASALLKAS